ncbi:TPA: hypothetical protein N2P55_003588 [Escherichia coli]|nr:hypothetical protein [Escherichia coli]HCL6287049.1 hypothetical protein [Escherichia coli]
MNTYKLSHSYSRLHGFYGVNTDLNLHQLNLTCAYLQLLRYDLPYLKGAEDTIGEDNGRYLLSTIYGMKPLHEEQPYGAELDFYDNWNDYCGGKLKTLTYEIVGVSMPNAFRAVISSLIKDCEESLEVKNPFDDADDQSRYMDDIKENISRLNTLLTGKPVDPAWGWRSLDGDFLDGRVYVRNDIKSDIPNCLFK